MPCYISIYKCGLWCIISECCAGTGGLGSPACGWGFVVVVRVRGKRLLGVKCCVYVVFKVLHGLWRLVWWLISGKSCVVWLK